MQLEFSAAWQANCTTIQDLTSIQLNEIQFQFNEIHLNSMKIQNQFNEIQFQFNEILFHASHRVNLIVPFPLG